MKLNLKHDTPTLNQSFGLSDDRTDKIADALIDYCLAEEPTFPQLCEYAIHTYANNDTEAVFIGIIAFQTPDKVKRMEAHKMAKKHFADPKIRAKLDELAARAKEDPNFVKTMLDEQGIEIVLKKPDNDGKPKGT